MIKIYDNFLSEKEKQDIYNFCKKQSYYRGEIDRPDCSPTGLVSDLNNQDIISKLIKPINNQNKIIERTYINLFLPNEKPYYHVDNNSADYKTCIYYVNTEKINYVDEEGETFFIDGDFKKGISFVSGRMVLFNANIMHKATAFRNLDRYTIAIKYRDVNIENE
jgi:hypothetical protein|tara:strand:+ start:199 stop:690 length:492 start_codon:yes stop_codon:yes gene_type:complete